MAQARGVTCDCCGAFVTTNDATPPGWLQLVVIGHDKLRETFDLCSNRCVRDLGKRRMDAERELSGTTYSGSARGAHLPKLNHDRHHATNPKPDCKWCQFETQPERRQA